MLGDFQVPVIKFVEVVLHVGKGVKFRLEKVNGGQNICNRVASVGNGRILKNKLSPLRVNKWLKFFVKPATTHSKKRLVISTNQLVTSIACQFSNLPFHTIL